MDDFEAYVNSDRFYGSRAWRSKLAKKKTERQTYNGTFEDMAASAIREELKPKSGLTDEAMQAIEAKHRFVFSALGHTWLIGRLGLGKGAVDEGFNRDTSRAPRSRTREFHNRRTRFSSINLAPPQTSARP